MDTRRSINSGTLIAQDTVTGSQVDHHALVEQELRTTIKADAMLAGALPYLARIITYARQKGCIPLMQELEADVWDRLIPRDTFRLVARQVVSHLKGQPTSVPTASTPTGIVSRTLLPQTMAAIPWPDQCRLTEQHLRTHISKYIDDLGREMLVSSRIIAYARQVGHVPPLTELESNVWDGSINRDAFRQLARQVMNLLRPPQESPTEVNVRHDSSNSNGFSKPWTKVAERSSHQPAIHAQLHDFMKPVALVRVKAASSEAGSSSQRRTADRQMGVDQSCPREWGTDPAITLAVLEAHRRGNTAPSQA
jgi:hypothetical protein